MFSTRAKCQEFVATYRDDGLLYAVDRLLCNTSAAIIVRQSKSPEDREIGRSLKLHLEVLAPKLQNTSPDKDAKVFFVVPALDVRAQVLSIYDRRDGVGKPVFSLAPLGYEQKFDVIAPGLCEPYITDEVLQKVC